MHTDILMAFAALFVGFLVGMTGAGGGALMTPILVLLFNVQPLAAISSDLVAALFMRPVGGFVHWRRGTVHFDLVKWLAVTSVPAAFCGVFVLRAFGQGASAENDIKVLLGWTLVIAASAIALKAAIDSRRKAEPFLAGSALRAVARPIPLMGIGLIGGLMVGMTSVGSGSLVIVLLMLLYPRLRAGELVGTDLVQAVPMVAAAALAHVLYGDFQLAITASVIIGSLPGVYLGARISSRASDAIVRPVIAIVLIASGLKLLNVATADIGATALALVLFIVPIVAALDAARRPLEGWEATGQSRSVWIWLMALGAPFGIGFLTALWYVAMVRPRLANAAAAPEVETAAAAGEVVA